VALCSLNFEQRKISLVWVLIPTLNEWNVVAAPHLPHLQLNTKKLCRL